MSVQHIDPFEFCRHSQQISGQTAIAELARLSAELVDSQGALQWVVTGGQSASGLPQLTVRVEGKVSLLCQRCLTPVGFDIASTSLLVLPRSEAEADETEARLDDESIDVIVATTPLDLMVLIEDDALLTLPLSPRHPVCPDGAAVTSVVDKAESPFAVLKKLK